MKIPEVFFTGNNVCHQTKLSAEIVDEFTAINIADICEVDQQLEIQKFSILITTHYCLISLDNKLYIRSSLLENNLRVLEFNSLIRKLSANDAYCLILVESGLIHKFDFIETELKTLDFLNLDSSSNHEDVCCSSVASYSRATNTIYAIPSKIFQFEKHQHIKKMVSGFEHCLILLKNGEVYSWGCGLRGQLGFGNIEIEERPSLIEGLAGIKMTDIAAAGFSSLACSSFGDLYGWGWNTLGELGIETGKSHLGSKKIETKQSVFVNPQIIELDEDDIKNVASGVNHSILTTNGGKYFCSGSNEFGQLGMKKDAQVFKCNKIKEDIFIDRFTELKSEHLYDSSEILCNHWSTVIINKRI